MTLNVNQHHSEPSETAPEDIGLLIDGLLDGKFGRENSPQKTQEAVQPASAQTDPGPSSAESGKSAAFSQAKLICVPNLSEQSVTVKSSLYPLNAPCQNCTLSLTAAVQASIGSDRPRSLKLNSRMAVTLWREAKLCVQNDIFKEDSPYIWDVTYNRPENLSVAFTLENGYFASVLRIKSITLGADGDSPDLEACGAKISSQGKPLEGGLDICDSQQFSLTFAETPPIGDYNLKLSITLEAPGPDRARREITKSYPILLKVKPQKIIKDGILAIDFGTTSSCAALVSTDDLYIFNVENERLTSLQDSEKKRLLSYISYNMPEPVLGRQAYDDARENPQACCSSPKSLIGSRNSVEILQNLNGRYTETQVPLQDIVRRFYRTLSKYAQDSLAKNGSAIKFSNFVITHPSRFNYSQIEQIKDAAFEAFKDIYQAEDIGCIKTVPEPIAVAFDYICDPLCQNRIHNKFGKDEITYTVLVYDCGGG
ncbi:Hsp70 family protein, partial [bacterium]|nr:Hsp70 family protein [bacterium]